MNEQERAVMQQALEALEQDNPAGRTATITALRAAPAQEPEPAQKPVWVKGELPPRYIARSPIQPEPGQEPVAKVELMTTGGNAGLATRIVEIDDHLRERLRPGQLLYTTPPHRPPLTDEEIAEVYREWDVGPWANIAEFARAIERKVRGETE